MEKKQDSSKGTLYRVRSRAKVRASQWHPRIQRLLMQGHTFLPYDFSADGYLFRGVSQGLLASLLRGEFGYFDDDRSLPALEQELGVFFVSHALSDALTVARLLEQAHDGGVLIFRSELFRRESASRRAAVLGFAEGGLIFKYPFLVQPLRLSDIDYLLVTERVQQRVQDAAKPMDRIKTIVLAPAIDAASADRVSFKQAIVDVLQGQHIQGATLVSSENWPRAG